MVIGDHTNVSQYFTGPPPVVWPQQVGLPPDRATDFHERAGTRLLDIARWGDTIVVTGLGGVGKTQLAAEFVRRCQADCDLRVWVAADSSASIVTVFSEAAQRLHLSAAEDAVAGARRFVDWLATTDRRWLVVLDDLADPLDVGDMWPPARPAGCTIVTTRRRDAALLARGTTVDVGAFSAVDAAQFLQDNLGANASATLLAEDLGYLPLALGHAIAYMRDLDLTYDEYRERLADRTRRLDELFSELSAGERHARAVASTWKVSIDAANFARPAGLAQPVLEFASHLDPNGIPTPIFSTAPALHWLAQRSGTDPTRIRSSDGRDALQALHRFNLISNERTMELARVHALVQRAVRESLGSQAPSVAAAVADALAEVWPAVEKDPAQGDRLRTNTFALYHYQPDALWSPDGNHRVLDRANRSLGDAALLQHAIEHAQQIAAEAERRLGAGHRCAFRWRSRWASWLGDAGSGAEAAQVLHHLAADAARLLGDDDPVTLDARANLAYQRGQAGDPIAAAAALQAVAADMSRIFGPRDRRTLRIRNEAGYWLGKGGQAGLAIDYLEPVLADAQQTLAANDRLMFDIRHCYGYWLGDAVTPAAAIPVLQSVLDDAERELGAHHRDVCGYRRNLAYWRGRGGDLKGAVDALQTVLGEYLDMFGLYHRDTLSTWMGSLEFRRQLGERTEIAEEVEQLVATYVDIHGPRHHETLNARELLAGLKGDLGDPAAAIEDLAVILIERETVFADDVRAIETTRQALAHWKSEPSAP